MIGKTKKRYKKRNRQVPPKSPLSTGADLCHQSLKPTAKFMPIGRKSIQYDLVTFEDDARDADCHRQPIQSSDQTVVSSTSEMNIPSPSSQRNLNWSEQFDETLSGDCIR